MSTVYEQSLKLHEENKGKLSMTPKVNVRDARGM